MSGKARMGGWMMGVKEKEQMVEQLGIFVPNSKCIHTESLANTHTERE